MAFAQSSVSVPTQQHMRQVHSYTRSIPRVPSGLRHSVVESERKPLPDLKNYKDLKRLSMEPMPGRPKHGQFLYPSMLAVPNQKGLANQVVHNVPQTALKYAPSARRRVVQSMPPPPHSQQTMALQQRRHSFQAEIPRVRLRIETNDSFEIQSFKSKETKIVHASRVRGWFRKVSGGIKYTLGSLFLSSRMITKGNRDIARGNAQINLSSLRSQRAKSTPDCLSGKSTIVSSSTYSNTSTGAPTMVYQDARHSESSSSEENFADQFKRSLSMQHLVQGEGRNHILPEPPMVKIPSSTDSDTTLKNSQSTSPVKTSSGAVGMVPLKQASPSNSKFILPMPVNINVPKSTRVNARLSGNKIVPPPQYQVIAT